MRDGPLEEAEALLRDPSCPRRVLVWAAWPRAKRLGVDAVVAANPSTPRWVLTAIARREWEGVVPGATAALTAVASNPNLPFRWLQRLSLEGSPQVLAAVASNPGCPDETLVWLASDWARPGVAAAAVSNPACPPATLARVAGDPGAPDDARLAAGRNPNCPPAARHLGGLLAD